MRIERRLKILAAVLSLLAIGLVSSCSSATPASVTASVTPMSAPTQVHITAAVLAPTEIPEPSLTATALPSPLVPSPSLGLLMDLAVIGPDVASRIQRFGELDISGQVVFSPDSRTFAVITEEGIYVYQADPLEQISFLKDGIDLVLSSAGKLLAWTSGDGVMAVWDVGKRTERMEVKGLSDNCCRQFAISPDGGYLIILDELFPGGGTVKLLDLTSEQEVHSWEAVQNFVFSPDRNILGLVSASEIEVTLWDLAGQQVEPTLSGFTTAAPWYSAVFSPDWRWMAWVTRAGGQLMDVVSGQMGEYFSGQVISFSPDGSILATSETGYTDGPCSGNVCLYDVASGDLLSTLIHDSFVWRPMEFSPDGSLLRTVAESRIRLWDLDLGQELAVLGTHINRASRVANSPDWHFLATVDESTIRLWDVTSQQELAVLRGHPDPVSEVVFSPDGRILATVDESTMKLWEVSTGSELTSIAMGSKRNEGLRFSPDGRILVKDTTDSETEESSVELWGIPRRITIPDDTQVIDPQNATALQTVAQLRIDRPSNAIFSPQADLLAVALQDGTIELWDMTGRVVSRPLSGHTGWVYQLALSPDGHTLASASMDGTARLWDVVNGEELQVLTGHSGEISSIAFAPDGQTLATGSQDGNIKVWNATTGAELFTLSDHTNWVWSVAFSPDGATLASASADRTLKVWDLETEKLMHTLPGHTATVWRGVFSPDGRILASASWDGTIKVWDVASGQGLRTLKGHSDWLYGVAFSPDGRILASASKDGEVKLWDVASGQEVATLSGHTDLVWSVAFSTGGRILASASEDGSIRLWTVSP